MLTARSMTRSPTSWVSQTRYRSRQPLLLGTARPCHGFSAIRVISTKGSTSTVSEQASGPASNVEVPAAPYNVLFCGTDSFASRSLAALITSSESGDKSVCASLHVLTPPDTVQRWGAGRMRTSPVKQLALEHGLPHHEVPADGMNNYQPPATFDLGPRSILLTCSFGHLIPDRLLDLFPYQYQRLNIHPSLLPQLRGAAPIQWAIARGLEQSGVSIQSLERGKFDTGRILAQHKCAFPSSTRGPSGRVVGGDGASGFLEIERVMAEKAAALLLDMLRDLPGHVANSWEQDEMQRTFAPKVRAQHSVVDWLTMSATQIVARDRAFSYLYQLNSTLVPPPGSAFPTAQTLFAGVDRVSLDSLSATCMPSHAKLVGAQPGTAVYSPNLDAVLIAAKEQQHTGLVQVTRFKTKGKKEKSAKDWWAAYRDRASPDGTLLFR